MSGALAVILTGLKVARDNWKLVLLIAVLAYAGYVMLDRAHAKAEVQTYKQSAARWQQAAASQQAIVDALRAANARMDKIMAARAEQRQTISRQIGDLSKAVSQANAERETAYGRCAGVAYPDALQKQFDLLLRHGGADGQSK